jgi:uncharacterized SAM-binding protein YcdF (DUF218 family)/lysophospholipase L1-like esterase
MTDPVQRRRTRRALLTGFALGIVFVLVFKYIIEHTMVVDWIVVPLGRGYGDTTGLADAIVVLGASSTGLCTPNYSGLQRVLRGAQLYHEGRAPMMVIVGGKTADIPCTLAAPMRDLAIRLGVPLDRIRLEETSRSTWENAERSDAVLKTIGASRILLVTDRTHIGRAEVAFRRFGYQIERASVPVLLGHISNWTLLVMGLREYAAWTYYWWRGYTGSAPAPSALVSWVEPSSPKQEPRVEGVTVVSRKLNDTVVLLGASYAAGWNIDSIGDLRVINRGMNGQQSWELLERFDRDVVAAAPRAVIIWGFINDIYRAERPKLGDALARTRQSLLTMIERGRANGIEPILATEVTVRGRLELREDAMALVGRLLGKQSYQMYVNRHVLDTNVWLREVARQQSLLLLDLQPQIAGPDGTRRREYSRPDGSHISSAGYETLTRYALPILNSHLARGSE